MSGLVEPLTKNHVIVKSVDFTTAATTATVWTPASGNSIALTDISIASAGSAAATILLFWGTANSDNPRRVWMGTIPSSTTLFLTMSGLESPLVNDILKAVTPVTGNFTITAYGFELPR